MQRIWKRNLGRDDRCIADNGKEVVLTVLKNIINCLAHVDRIDFLFLLG